MKYSFHIRYEIDAPLAIAVAAYLDCEHYIYLHRALTSSIDILESGPDFYKCRQSWKVLGLTFGETHTSRYRAPATFVNEHVRPDPLWLPSIHHVIRTNTVLRYFENPESKTTLSDLLVELDLPFWLYPFRGLIRRVVEKTKILKDLEDVALIDRRKRLYGRDSNAAYLKSHQFLLHKDGYVKYFGDRCRYLGDPAEVTLNERWTDIRRLNFPYVRRFLERDYIKYANFRPA